MAILRIALTIEYGPSVWYDDDESKRWLFGRVLDPRQLVLHSNESGDSVGTIIAADVIDDNAPAMRKVYERGDGEYDPSGAK